MLWLTPASTMRREPEAATHGVDVWALSLHALRPVMRSSSGTQVSPGRIHVGVRRLAPALDLLGRLH